ncbi:hypothetical protein CONPUDRAFT_140329 [Coniophora puteana RWD-64-598 SS2]|uniref:DUF6534 domain-containing protein n=1 Tax=Coniophora puteana (strain RWD-64-598) TaxID=741705 RepID=A0A5M3M7U9_CONPW|nr:uncharacterized protein CONPUDRAFT_140329 [Coniophora puteana RWD-64-598 SS2]EIW74986.1 hypothetical protein CONPUDRAFT_140329 [Coniophora puteana RWD-64-598 SS2]
MEHAPVVGCLLLGVLCESYIFPSTIIAIDTPVPVNTFLFGIVSQRYVVYFASGHARPEERNTIKMMVSLLCLLDTVFTILQAYGAWHLIIANYGNASMGSATIPWPVCLNPIATECTAMATQMFLTSRIWRLHRSHLLVGISIFLASMSFVVGFAGAAELLIFRLHADSYTQRGARGILGSLVISWSALQVATDVFITASLIVILCRARKGLATASARRNYGRIIDTLIHGSIQTGVLAGGWAIGTFVAVIAWPQSDLSGAISICLGRIYTITLLDILMGSTRAGTDTDDTTSSIAGLPQLTSAIGDPTFDDTASQFP